MKNIASSVLFTLAIAVTCGSVFADSIVVSYTCKLKEGKKIEDVQAANSTWLKWVRANVNPNIKSEVGTAVVGAQDMFLFADTYPDLATWAATQTALDSDAGDELDGNFAEVTDCSENRLWKFEPTP